MTNDQKQTEPAEPHAELRAMYEQQVKDGIFHNFTWELLTIKGAWEDVGTPAFADDCTYRCTQKPNLVKLNGKLMSREAAIAEWESKKDACDVWYRSDADDYFSKQDLDFCWNVHDPVGREYELHPKPLKQVSWKDVPVGAAVVCPLDGEICEYKGVNGDVLSYYSSSNFQVYEADQNRFDDAQRLELSPSDQQPWIAVQDCFNFPRVDGLIYKFDSGRFKVTGIAKGWELK